MLAIEERGQKFSAKQAMDFFKVATNIFSFLYCMLHKLKQLFTILKLLQRSIFKR